MLQWLKQPYPISVSPVKNGLMALGLGLFVFLFTYFFQPLGISEECKNVPFIQACAVFGLIVVGGVAVVLILGPIIFPRYFNEDKWKVYHELLNVLYALILITIANIFYGQHASLIGNAPMSLSYLLESVFSTVMIGIFPVTMFILYKYVTLIKSNRTKVESYNALDRDDASIEEMSKYVSIKAKSEKDSIEVDLKTLLFIESSGNYLEFHFIKDNKYDRTIVRNSLQYVQDQLSDVNYMLRTHRTYLVNMYKVKKFKGNAQGYQLKFEEIDKLVPVSRGRLQAFDHVMKNIT